MDVSNADCFPGLDQLQVVVDVGKGELEHLKDEGVSLLNQIALLLLQGGKPRGIHLRQGIDVVSSTQLRVDLHDELSLALEFLAVDELFTLEIQTCLVGLLALPDLVHPCLDYLVLQDDALL